MSVYSRREAGTAALAALPFARTLGAVSSKIHGVVIGAITYSFRSMKAEEIVPAMVKIGLGSAELMSNHAEALAGGPAVSFGPPSGTGGPGGAPPTPEQRAAMRARMNSPEAQKAREELRQWRSSVSMDKFKAVRKPFDDAGIDVPLLCFNMNRNTTEEEMDYAFRMAQALRVKAITCSTQVTVAKRVAPFADKYKMMFAGHNHSNLDDPEEFATPKSFETIMSYSKYIGVQLDIGHFTAAGFDPVAYISEHHARITGLHLKDRKKSQGPNMPWGQGETPIKEVLQLLKKQRYPFPANIEYEYRIEGAETVAEVAKCLQYCKDALA